MWYQGQFLEKSRFCQELLNSGSNLKFVCTHVAYLTVIIFRTQNIVSTKLFFRYIHISLSNLAVFSAKSPTDIQKSDSQENDVKKSQHQSPFLDKNLGSNNSFTLIENNF